MGDWVLLVLLGLFLAVVLYLIVGYVLSHDVDADG